MISDVIKLRLEAAGKRYFACDNISEYIRFGEKEELIQELTLKFQDVLSSLVIDVENDPNSKDTARRLSKMYINEIMSGRYQKEPDVTSFPNDSHDQYHGILVVKAEIKSICAHHHQPILGTAYIGIIPDDHVLGLSKYIRIAQFYARRGQLQEQLTNQICQAIKDKTKTNDVAVYIEASHGCVSCRGVLQNDSNTQTTVLSGEFVNQEVRKEFYDLIKLQKG